MEALRFIQDHWDEIVMIVGAVGVACEGTIAALVILVGALRSLAGFLATLAAVTGTGTDDRLVAAFIRGLDACARGLEAAQRWIPRLRVGASRKPVSPGASAALGALLAVVVGLSGCGASWIDVARDTTAGGALAAVAVDPVLADRYDALTLDCDRGLLDEATCTERLRRLDRADRALRSFADSMVTVDLALGAYEDGRECGLRPALEGAARAARELVATLDAAGIAVPPLVAGVLQIAEVMLDAPECEPSADDVETARTIQRGLIVGAVAL